MVVNEIPLNQGCLNPITLKIPDLSILSPDEDVAVVGGNVLTSQRVVDVILKVVGVGGVLCSLVFLGIRSLCGQPRMHEQCDIWSCFVSHPRRMGILRDNCWWRWCRPFMERTR